MDWDFGQQILFWAFVPKLATQFLQKQYYAYRRPKRAPTASEQKRHFKYIYVVLVVGYLFYTFVELERSLPKTHYDYLGVSRNADAKELRASFKKQSLLNHPDKLQDLTDQEKQESDFRYMHILNGYSVLKEPLTRSIYDKFGPTTVQGCVRCISERDFMLKALPGVIMFYAGSAAVLLVLSVFGTLNFGRYWRFVGLFTMASIETSLLMGPPESIPARVLGTLIPWRTTHEYIAMLHQLFVIVSVATSQLGPILWPTDTRTTKNLLDELENVTNLQLKESVHQFRTAFEPFARDPRTIVDLQKKMEKLTVDLKLHETEADLTVAHGQAAMRVTRRK
ncbi:hypothetical protein HKX48_007613 [Thoreauomyces humboldtii]|nr:hypothetical protein HKX48_007613 [Thoreauomyces humboldtii]